MKFKKGDTLVEVALAIGIFSVVAIAVVSVVNGSTSSAQSTLEITIAREEIDAQAEALRFIHNSYQTGDDTGGASSISTNTFYNKLWDAITSLATSNASALDYSPSTCEDLYKNGQQYLKNNGAFVLNTRKLASNSVNSVLYSAQNSSALFQESTTYPRLVHSMADAGENSSLVDQNSGEGLYRAEGIFVIPFKDPGTTTVVTGSSLNIIPKKSAYYDFYIRTCWYTPGADHPSTISTVVRLYDPGSIDF